MPGLFVPGGGEPVLTAVGQVAPRNPAARQEHADAVPAHQRGRPGIGRGRLACQRGAPHVAAVALIHTGQRARRMEEIDAVFKDDRRTALRRHGHFPAQVLLHGPEHRRLGAGMDLATGGRQIQCDLFVALSFGQAGNGRRGVPSVFGRVARQFGRGGHQAGGAAD